MWGLIYKRLLSAIKTITAMANFNIAYQFVEAAEGGFQIYSTDPGNYNSLGQLVGTNWGISAPVYEDWIGRPPTRQDMESMSKEEAKQIYRSKYWDRIRGDEIQSQAVANVFLDGHVNHGRSGIRMMQKVVDVDQDGIVGPITLAAINSRPPNAVVRQYIQEREKLYYWLAENRDGMAMFLNGWLNRLDMFRQSLPAGGEALAGVAIAIGLYFFLHNP